MSKNKTRNNIEYKNKCPICKIVCIDQLMHVDGKEIPIHTYLCPTCGRMYGNSINHSYMEKMTIVSDGKEKYLYNLLPNTAHEGLKTVLINGNDEQVIFTNEDKINAFPFHVKPNICQLCDCDLKPIYLCTNKQKENIPVFYCEQCGIYYVDKEVADSVNCFKLSKLEIDKQLEETSIDIDFDKLEDYKRTILSEINKYINHNSKYIVDNSKLKAEKALFIDELTVLRHRYNIYSLSENFFNRIDSIIKEGKDYIEQMNAKKELAKKNKVELFIVDVDQSKLTHCPCCSRVLNGEYTEMYDVDLDALMDVKFKRCTKCNKKYIGINQKKEYDQLTKSILGLYIKNFVMESPSTPSHKVIVYVYKNAFGNKCIKNKHPEELVSMETINMKTGVRKFMNVSHCKICNKYWIESSKLEEFTSRMFKPNFKYEFNESFSIDEKSTMKLYGYTVGKTKGLIATKRHDIIDMLLFHNLMTPSKMIGLLSNNVRKAEAKKNVDMSDAISDWEDDIKYIRNDYPAKKAKLIGVIKPM